MRLYIRKDTEKAMNLSRSPETREPDSENSKQ